MQLLDIVNGANYKLNGNVNIDVKDIKIDSRKVSYGDMFIALTGSNFDGNNYILDAINNGASVVVTDKNFVSNAVTSITVEDTRKVYSIFCNNFFNNPNKKLKSIAVVGTNGKTTTTYILKSVLEKANKKVGIIGTLGIIVDNEKYPNNLTTPDPYELNKYLSIMVNKKVEYAIIEVSSHAIYFNKTYPIVFDYVIFTNFSEDHLDFFECMYNYFYTKLSFFNTNNVKVAIVNSDDLLGKVILTNKINLIEDSFPKEDSSKKFFDKKDYLAICDKFKNLQKISYGINNPSDVFAIDISSTKDCTKFIVNAFDKIYEIKSNLIGLYNVYNLLSAISLLEVIGIDYKYIYKGIDSLKFVEGRLNKISYNGKNIIIDFAHTEDALKNLLTTCRSLCTNKLIVLFGCGGNRDKTKRKAMGSVASKLSDYVILTSDNPRYEEPTDIINDIKKGVNCKNSVIIDRFDAIKYGIGMLSDDDLLVIAGKGGETTQEINGNYYPFSDKDVVNKILGIKD